MTDDKLEKEVTEYLNTQTLPKIDDFIYRVIKNLIFGFAEPKEKQMEELKKKIKLLGERCNQLLADKGKLTDELDEWKAEWNDQVIKANEEGFARTKQTIQLSKAKDLLEKAIKNTWSIDYFVVDEINEFLKDLEKQNKGDKND